MPAETHLRYTVNSCQPLAIFCKNCYKRLKKLVQILELEQFYNILDIATTSKGLL